MWDLVSLPPEAPNVDHEELDFKNFEYRSSFFCHIKGSSKER